MSRLQFTYNDGGRRAAGYTGIAGDCVCRSIAIITGIPYQQVYDVLADGNMMQRKSKRSVKNAGKRTASHGISVNRKWFQEYMKSIGFRWIPCMQIGSGCKVHLCAGEVPMDGKIIARVSKHYTSIINGVIHDIYDPSRGGDRCVYGYWLYIN